MGTHRLRVEAGRTRVRRAARASVIFKIVVFRIGNMKRKPLDVKSLLAVVLVSIGAAIVNSSEVMAQAPKTETAPAAATEVKPAPAEVKPAPPPAAPATEVGGNPHAIQAPWRD